MVAPDLAKPAYEIIAKDGFKGSKAWALKTSSSYQADIIGVVSTQPSDVIGRNFEESENPRPITLSGRVPVKVSTENGPIHIGDPLTSSSISGVAMKATRPGPIIGKALESFEDSEVRTILVFINISYFIPSEDLERVDPTEENSPTFVDLLFSDITRFFQEGLNKLGLTVENGVARLGRIIADTGEFNRIQLRDQATGEPYCTWIENGEWVKQKGSCETP